MRPVVLVTALLLAAGSAPAASEPRSQETTEKEAVRSAGAVKREAGTSRRAAAGAKRRTVEGRIASLDPQASRFVIASARGRSLEVRATPRQLGGFEVDDPVTLRLVRYGRQWWVAGGPEAAAGEPGRPRTAVGEVAEVSQAEGRLVIAEEEGERTLQAHPGDLEGLKPGQLVSVTYESGRSGSWLRAVKGEVEAAARAPGPKPRPRRPVRR